MPHAVRRLTRHARSGFTLPEMLIVVVMISVLALFAIPRFANINGKRHMESARMRIGAALVTARQAAIQKGQTVRFSITSHRVKVQALGTDTTNLVSPVPLDTLYKVKTDADITIEFSSRGFANLSTSGAKIYLTRADVGKDSVSVTKTGMVQR